MWKPEKESMEQYITDPWAVGLIQHPKRRPHSGVWGDEGTIGRRAFFFRAEQISCKTGWKRQEGILPEWKIRRCCYVTHMVCFVIVSHSISHRLQVSLKETTYCPKSCWCHRRPPPHPDQRPTEKWKVNKSTECPSIHKCTAQHI